MIDSERAAAALPSRSSATCSPYELILGDAFALLHRHVRRAHMVPVAADGILDVAHGAHWLVPLIIRLMKLPPAGAGQRVRLEVQSADGDVEWVRRIGPSILRTRQSVEGSRLVERHGPGRLAFTLAVEDGALVYTQSSMHVAGVVIPARMCPRVQARVSPAATGWRVDVTVTWRGRLVCRYGGVLEPT